VRLRDLRTRLALLVFAITLVAVGVIYAYVIPPLQNRLTKQRLESLEATAKRVTPSIDEVRYAEIKVVERAVRRASDRANARVTLLRVSRGSLGLQTGVVADSTGARETPDLQFEVASQAARSRHATTGTESGDQGRLGQAAVPIVVAGDAQQVVVLSAPLADVERNVALVRRRVVVAGIIALLLAFVAGFALAQRLTRRIKRLERTARAVARGDLSQRFLVDSEDELGRLAVALDDMQRQLRQLDSARRRFIATASHELRTPLFSLSGFLELIEDEDLDTETRDAFMVQLRDQVERLKKLASGLLDLSRLESGALELRPEPTDVRMLARAVASEFGPALTRHESQLRLRLGSDPVEADIDPERVGQILRILIDNALAHTPAGTDMIVTTGREDGLVRLTVRDFGGGIRRQALERLFEPFFSAGDTQGTGLGLAIARELADRMQGRLTVEALAGRTTFTLELPA
jgi:signal transduction histidine kinase